MIGHPEYFILQNLEAGIFLSSWESSVAVLRFLVLFDSFKVVCSWKVSFRIIVDIAFVRKMEIEALSEGRTILFLVVDQPFRIHWYQLLFPVQRDQETMLAIFWKFLACWLPGVLTETSDNLPLFCSHKRQGIWFFITSCMKSLSTKIRLWSSEE